MSGGEMLLETGMGADLHGGDATKAACRAVQDAVSRVSLLFLRTLSRDRRRRVEVEVRIGVPHPEAVDVDAVAATLPVGRVAVHCEAGGLAVEPITGDPAIIAVAAVIVRMDLEG